MLYGRRNEGDVPASNQAIEIRRRKREICNIVHNSTWVIETFMLSINILLEILALRIEPYILLSISDTIGSLCSRLVVPFTSLFAEQRIKVIVMERGWISAIKEASKFKHFTQVVPLHNNRDPIPSSRNQRDNNQPTSHLNVSFHLRGRNNSHSNIDSSKVEKTSNENQKNFTPENSSHQNNQIPGSMEEPIN